MRGHALPEPLHSALMRIGLAIVLVAALAAGTRPADAAEAVPNVALLPVPNLVGLSQLTATAQAGLSFFSVGTITSGYSPTVPVGYVMAQNPPAGTYAVQGSPINLTISSGGGNPAPVPSVIGLSAAAAQQAITTVNKVYVLAAQGPSPIGAAGLVYAQNPEAGTVVVEGTKVSVWVSTGPSAQGWVPPVVGQTQTSAATVLTAAGLAVGTVTTQFSPTAASGTVLSQSPASGVTLTPGSPVNLTVSKGRAPLLELSLVPKVDFNGDYKSDILIQSAYGSANILLMDGTTFTALPDKYPVVSYLGGWRLAGVGDFDGDGKSDMVVENADGQLYVELMNGYVPKASTQVLPAGTGWRLALVGDFDGDGKADLLLRRNDGSLGVWLMNGATVKSIGGLLGPASGWSPVQVGGVDAAGDVHVTIAQTGDFNGDGKTDLLLRHTDGRIALWLMDGKQVLSGTLLFGAGSAWGVSRIGDFNGDGKDDILWSRSDGMVYLTLMNGTAVTSGAPLVGPGTGWSVAQVGDFNGDGRSDILWKHVDGWVAMWLMNGTAVLANAPLLAAGSGWGVAQVGDFDGDGKTDILLEKRSNGALAAAVLWLMDGVTVTQAALLGYTWATWDLKP